MWPNVTWLHFRALLPTVWERKRKKTTGDLGSSVVWAFVDGNLFLTWYCTALSIIEGKCWAEVWLWAVSQELLNCAGGNCDGIMSEEEETPSPPCWLAFRYGCLRHVDVCTHARIFRRWHQSQRLWPRSQPVVFDVCIGPDTPSLRLVTPSFVCEHFVWCSLEQQ